jgi:UDP-glucose 4-epimerase
MKYLITGGAGFVGSHLTDLLISQGHDVHIIDDLSSGRLQNIEHLRSNPRFKATIDTVLNEDVLEPLIDEADIVYHLAAAVGTRMIVESPVKTIELNVGGTEAVLRLANAKKRTTLVASTSEVYGKNTQVPFHEEMDLVLGPTSVNRWSYACSKAADEFLSIAYWREKKLPTIVVRLFNTVGPRQIGQYGMVIPRMVKHALAGEPILVHGDGKQTRCFAFVGDVVHALSLLPHHKDAFGRVFNVGNDQEITILELAEKVRAKVNPDCEIKFISYEDAFGPGFEDMRKRVPDVRRLHELTSYRPTTSIDTILDHVIAWMRKE